MSTRQRAAVVLGLLVLMTGFGVMAVASTPDGGRAIGIWPSALATATYLFATRWQRLVLVPVSGVLCIGSVWLGGRPADVAIGLGLGLSVESYVTWRLLTGGRDGRVGLRTMQDLSRLIVAVGSGALVMSLAGVLTSTATGWGDPFVLAATVGTSSLAAQLTLLPVVCEWRQHPALAGPVERAAQWLLLLATTCAVFIPTDIPSLVLLVLPVLAWGAVRSGSIEAALQMIFVVGLAILLTTYGRGPFARPDLRFDVPPDTQGILLGTFGTVCALVMLTLNLTVGEQHENARQVAAERDRLRNVVDGITGTAIIGADLDGLITLFNPGAQRLLGYDAEDVLGRPTRILHSDRDIAAKAAELGVPDDYEEVGSRLIGVGPTQMGFVRKDGEERQHLMSLNQVIDDRGEVIGYVSTSEDVTERLRAEARLVEALETERQAVEQLREVDRVKDAFVSSVSHELRTPITSILGYTELLEDGTLGNLEAPQADALGRIRRNSDRLLTLISELLTLSRVQAAEDGLETSQVVDLAQVVAAGVAVLSPTVASRDLQLTVDLPSLPIQVTGDRDMLERVVINLTDNAVKFTPDGGQVSVALTSSSGHAVLEVADTGIGVPAHEQQRLFDRFFRSSLAQHHAIPGSGLGLSIAHKIVEKHGGTLEVRSEAGRGSTFRVRLPV